MSEQTSPSMFCRICLVIFGTVISLLATEIGFRSANGTLLDTTLLTTEVRKAENDASKYWIRYDPLLGWIPNQGTRIVGRSTVTVGPDTLRVHGSRNQFAQRRPILAVGDSFTFGNDVNDDESWPAYLEQALSRTVLNGGVSGYGFDQTVLRAEMLTPKFDPELLIVGFIPDDLRRSKLSIRLNPKPYFVLEENQAILRNIPVPLRDGIGKVRKLDWFRSIGGYSHAIDFFMRRIDLSYWLDAPIVLAEWGPLAVGGSEGAIELNCVILDRLLKLRSERRKILLVAQHEYFLSEEERYMARSFLDCAAKKGFDSLDLYTYLRGVRDNSWYDFANMYTGHMTAFGNSSVATKIAEKIVDLR